MKDHVKNQNNAPLAVNLQRWVSAVPDEEIDADSISQTIQCSELISLTFLSDDELNDMPRRLTDEWTRRLAQQLKKGDRVVTMVAGFCGLAGEELNYDGYEANRGYLFSKLNRDYADRLEVVQFGIKLEALGHSIRIKR